MISTLCSTWARALSGTFLQALTQVWRCTYCSVLRCCVIALAFDMVSDWSGPRFECDA